MLFGDILGDIDLAETLWKLFCNSTAESTKRTYAVSSNHFRRFVASCDYLPLVRYIPNQLSQNGLILCFFTAYLFRLPSINSAKTIGNYSYRVKAAQVQNGLTFARFDTSVHRDILNGIERLLPNKPDSRPAFLLPHYLLPPIFAKPRTYTHLLLKAAVT